VREKALSFLRGTVEAFFAVNFIMAVVSYTAYPDFFHLGLLLRPQVLILTVPLSVAFHLNVKYLARAMEDSDEDIWDRFEEVKPDFD
jgi:hypothetical protein